MIKIRRLGAIFRVSSTYWVLVILNVSLLMLFPSHCVVVRGGSMVPGLLPGDCLWVKKITPTVLLQNSEWPSSARPLRRREVVVFRLSDSSGRLYIKRLVGLPGDH